MVRYPHVSGAFLALIALAQLTRALLQLPAQVGNFVVPVWFSFVAFVVSGSLALWGFRAARGS